MFWVRWFYSLFERDWRKKTMFIHTNHPLITSFYIKREPIVAELAMSLRWSAIFCATGAWGGKPYHWNYSTKLVWTYYKSKNIHLVVQSNCHNKIRIFWMLVKLNSELSKISDWVPSTLSRKRTCQPYTQKPKTFDNRKSW